MRKTCAMTDPVSAGSPKVASFNATAISASDYILRENSLAIIYNGVSHRRSLKH